MRTLSQQDEQEFRVFCQNATLQQLRNIYKDEKIRARDTEDPYYLRCAEIAEQELAKREP